MPHYIICRHRHGVVQSPVPSHLVDLFSLVLRLVFVRLHTHLQIVVIVLTETAMLHFSRGGARTVRLIECREAGRRRVCRKWVQMQP